MKLQQLRYFCTACRCGNITRAAQELHVSQPSVTSAIRELEEEFGLALHQRVSKGFVLTQEGRIFLSHAQKLLLSADGIGQIMADLRRQRNLICIGIPPMIGTFLFPPIFRAFHEAFPAVRLRSQEQGTRQLTELLLDETLDLAILPTNNLDKSLFNILNFYSTETVFCVHPQHPLAGAKTVGIRQICGEPLVMFNDGFYQNEVIAQRYRQYGFEPNVVHYTGQLFTMKTFITEGISSGFMFRDVAAGEPGLVGISLDEPILVQIGLVWKKNRYLFSDTMKFIDCVKAMELPGKAQ